MEKAVPLTLMLFLVVAWFAAVPVKSQEPEPSEPPEQPETSRVSLIVSADDTVTARIVRDVMSSDMFPGYVIVKEDWDYLIDVLAFQIAPEVGPGAGITMSVLTLEPSTNKLLNPMAELLPDTVYTVINHCAFELIPETDHFVGRCDSADPALRQSFNLIGTDLMRWKYSSREEPEP